MLKVGIFGAGHLGKIHIQEWLEIPDVQLIGFFDPDSGLARQVSAATGIPAFDTLEQLINASQVLDIVSPTLTHFPIAKACIKQSRHLFVSSPMTHTLGEARELVQLAAEANVKCHISHVDCYHPAILALKDYVVKPKYVEAHRLLPYRPGYKGFCIIRDLMIHDIDLLLYLIKAPVRRISAHGVAVINASPDIANARIEFDNGCVANLTSSRIAVNETRKMRLFQQELYFNIDFLEIKTEIVRLKQEAGMASKLLHPDLVSMPEQALTIRAGDHNAIRTELKDFIQAIKATGPAQRSLFNGLKTIEIAHQIIQKMMYTPNPDN